MSCGDLTNVVTVLLSGSALVGLALGFYLSWRAIAVSGIILALVSAVLLKAGFGPLVGIAIAVACLAANQIGYLIGVALRDTPER
jgi:hypothetical protein